MVGDIIEKLQDKQSRKILGVIGDIYFVSNDGEYDDVSFAKTLSELKRMGYTIENKSTKIQEAIDLLVKEGKIVDGKIIK